MEDTNFNVWKLCIRGGRTFSSGWLIWGTQLCGHKHHWRTSVLLSVKCCWNGIDLQVTPGIRHSDCSPCLVNSKITCLLLCFCHLVSVCLVTCNQICSKMMVKFLGTHTKGSGFSGFMIPANCGTSTSACVFFSSSTFLLCTSCQQSISAAFTTEFAFSSFYFWQQRHSGPIAPRTSILWQFYQNTVHSCIHPYNGIIPLICVGIIITLVLYFLFITD